MASLTRSIVRISRTRCQPVSFATQPRRFAHQSYGNEQSGHEQGVNEPNPKRHLEHPGPEAPAATGADKKDSSSSGGKPTISEPHSPQEESNPEVRKHNEELRHRHDRSANQLADADNKVDKKFWKGDVGDMSQDKSDDTKSK